MLAAKVTKWTTFYKKKLVSFFSHSVDTRRQDGQYTQEGRRMASKVMLRTALFITILALCANVCAGKSAWGIANFFMRAISAMFGATSFAFYVYSIVDPLTKKNVSLPAEYIEMQDLLLLLDSGYGAHEETQKRMKEDNFYIEHYLNITSLTLCLASLVMAVIKTIVIKKRKKNLSDAKGTESANITNTTLV